MIVTFQVAIYLVYRFFENYFYPIFNDNESEEISDDFNGLTNLQPVPQITNNIKVDSETNVNVVPAPRNDPVSNVQSSDIPNVEVKESVKGISETFLDTIENQEGLKFIYNVEPTFECYLDSDGGIKFIPPVYTQRYMMIGEILNQACWKNSIRKVVDFGCAELTFEVRNLKKIFGIQDIVSVDIDLDLLERNACRLTPTATDYLACRPTPLEVRIFCGSVGCTNEALDGADAVIAIELIEHLFPDDLEKLPFTVFGYINPLIAIFTTPNADFNVLFKNFSGFRHDDHKFEWSRRQFEDWGNNLVQRYPEYTVDFRGIGPGYPGTEHLGCCSQMAVFVKVHHGKSLSEDERHSQYGEYKLVREEIYPFFEDKRTRSEILRDEANFYINNIKCLSNHYNEEKIKEIRLNDVMKNIKCHNKERLVGILRKENWNISTNSDGEEVIEIPESDEESDYSNEIVSEGDYEPRQTNDEACFHNAIDDDECWDIENIKPNSSEMDELCLDCSVNDKTVTINDCGSSVADCLCIHDIGSSVSIVTESFESSTPLVKAIKNTSKVKTHDLDDDSDLLLSPCFDNVLATHVDCSVYETPCNTVTKLLGSEFQFKTPYSTCKKSIAFETSEVDQKSNCCAHEVVNCDVSPQSKVNSFCCVSSSSCDISTYATPYCSPSQKKIIQKSHSLEQINSNFKLSSVEMEKKLFSKDVIPFGKQKEQFSRSAEGFKSQDSCDVLDTLSSASRIVDSGYPDSYSDHNMDMDLTPEQFEDIGTESKSSLSSRSLSPQLFPLHPLPHMIDNVENGDVANNNRDGEGNNMVADMEEEPLEFEAQIEEINHEIPNMGAVDQAIKILPECLERPEDSIPIQESWINNCKTQSENIPALETQSSWTILPENPNTNFFAVENNSSTKKQTVRSTKSDLSIATSSTWSHLDSSESQTSCHSQEIAIKSSDKKHHNKIKSYNSLTTVLNGCSKFSDCSIVRPVCNVMLQNDNIDSNNTNEDGFPKWLLNIDYSVFCSSGDDERLVKDNRTSLSLQDQLSMSSVYQSVGSLNSLNFDNVDEVLQFPQWLLNIQPSDNEDEIINQDWIEEGFDEVPALVYNVQVDARGGGDPQRDTWF